MRKTNNLYPKTWLKKFWEIEINKETFRDEWLVEYALTQNDTQPSRDIIVYTNLHHRVKDVKLNEWTTKDYNKGLYLSLKMFTKKWGLIAR